MSVSDPIRRKEVDKKYPMAIQKISKVDKKDIRLRRVKLQRNIPK
jgi:hypothetical protein